MCGKYNNPTVAVGYLDQDYRYKSVANKIPLGFRGTLILAEN